MRANGRNIPALVHAQVLICLGLTLVVGDASADEPHARGSVYAVNPHIDGPIILAGATATIVPYALADRIIDTRCPCDPNEVDGWDRGAIDNHSNVAGLVSDLAVGAAVLGPVAIELLGTRRPYLTLIEDLTVFAEVLAVNAAAVTLVKHWVQRPLPRTYEGEVDLVETPYGYRAFYSGHAATAFAALSTAAMTAGYRHGHRWWPWLASLALGSTVAAGRVLGGYHFYSDVVVGALAGTTFGVGIPLIHRRRGADREAEGWQAWSVRPIVQVRHDVTALLFSFTPR
ncbi:MAG TPA: phosphatase PAP2 family protein [Polyangia bacterium]